MASTLASRIGPQLLCWLQLGSPKICCAPRKLFASPPADHHRWRVDGCASGGNREFGTMPGCLARYLKNRSPLQIGTNYFGFAGSLFFSLQNLSTNWGGDYRDDGSLTDAVKVGSYGVLGLPRCDTCAHRLVVLIVCHVPFAGRPTRWPARRGMSSTYRSGRCSSHGRFSCWGASCRVTCRRDGTSE